jgi:alkylation response protein AidB-like acyl-CoA dehydrogenase
MAVLSEEQTMLRDGAKEWVAEKAPVSALRKLRDGKAELGFDPAAWKEMGEMGWAGVIVPEAYGGSEFGYRSLGLVLEETGRTLTASPLISTALVGAAALTLGGTAAQKEAWLGKIAAAETVVALAVDETAHHHPAGVAMKAEKAGAGYVLTGKKPFVLDGMAAELLVVAARTSGEAGEEAGVTLFLVPADVRGLTRTRLHTVDSRGAADLAFEGVEVGADAVLGQADHGFDLLDQILDRARAGLAAEMVGTAGRLPEDPHPVRPVDRNLPGAAAPRRQDVHPSGNDPLLRRGGAGRH